jgi:DNA-binding MarR family transcriptional regulator
VEGQAMDQQEQVEMSLRDLLNKMTALNKFKMKDCLKGYQSSEVHCIEYIGSHSDPNVTQMAESFFLTRGAISKMTKKLLQKGLIESYQNPDNRKEIYFKLTEPGQAVYKIHESLHREFQERDKAIFEQITAEQFEGILRFVELYGRHLDAEIQRLGVDITTGNGFE